MKVLKFGGTSVGLAENLYKIRDILAREDSKKIIVCSAMSGITDQLINLVEKTKYNQKEQLLECQNIIRDRHYQMIEELIDDQNLIFKLKSEVSSLMDNIFDVLYQQEYSEELRSIIITSGEYFLTHIFSCFLNHIGVYNKLLDAKDFMHVDIKGNPDTKKIKQKLDMIMNEYSNSDLFITQGFICKDSLGHISHFKRGGSDYSATIIGAVLEAEEIQIWTDIDGVHNNDPRYVSETYPVSYITYEEAANLAFFGAVILHPQTVSPVVDKRIPIIIKNTFAPNAIGTIISNKTYQYGLKAISAKDNIIFLNVRSNKVLPSYEYCRKVFEIFDKYKMLFDIVVTSNIEISLAANYVDNFNEVLNELKTFSEVKVDYENSIISLVGEGIIDDRNSSKIFEILDQIKVKMMSYGSNNNNISILIHSEDKIEVLNLLNDKLFRVSYKVLS